MPDCTCSDRYFQAQVHAEGCPAMTTREDEMVERLRSQAHSASKAHKMLADAKTARQTDGGGPYGYVTPEQTIEWQAADALTALSSERDRLRELLERVWACRMESGGGRFVNLAKLRVAMADIGAALTGVKGG